MSGGWGARVLAGVENAASGKEEYLYRALDPVGGSLGWDIGNTKTVVEGVASGVNEEDVVFVGIFLPTDIAITVLKAEEDEEAVLLESTLKQGVLRHAYKLYFWGVSEVGWIDASTERDEKYA